MLIDSIENRIEAIEAMEEEEPDDQDFMSEQMRTNLATLESVITNSNKNDKNKILNFFKGNRFELVLMSS